VAAGAVGFSIVLVIGLIPVTVEDCGVVFGHEPDAAKSIIMVVSRSPVAQIVRRERDQPGSCVDAVCTVLPERRGIHIGKIGVLRPLYSVIPCLVTIPGLKINHSRVRKKVRGNLYRIQRNLREILPGSDIVTLGGEFQESV